VQLHALNARWATARLLLQLVRLLAIPLLQSNNNNHCCLLPAACCCQTPCSVLLAPWSLVIADFFSFRASFSNAAAGCAVGNAGPGCTPCPIGSYSLAGASQCTSCPSGFSSPIASVGPDACYPLPAAAVSKLAVVPSALYHYLLSQPCTSVLSGDFGGKTLNSAVYCIPSAVSLSASVILDAQNNAAAVFIFQIDGAFTTAAGLTISVINGSAQVYYVAVGAATLGANSVVTGTVVALQAITLGSKSHISDLALSLVGTVNIGAGASVGN
jgi:hypothetical protein